MATEPNIYQARVRLTGTTGLVLDNIDAADPENPITIEIRKITDKGQDMTDEDRKRKDWLAYHASLYLDRDKRLVLPWRCIKRALCIGAYYVGSASLSGKMDKGVETSATEFALHYDGPGEVGKLYDDPQFRLRLMVNKNPNAAKKAMVPSVRPILPAWSLDFNLAIFNEVIGWDKFMQALERTGASVGIGNARKLGYGRFTAEAERL